MVQYITRMLPSGETVKYRKNPPRDDKGKAIPTKKQLKARKEASKRMKEASKLLKKEHGESLKPGTKAYGNAMREYLTKNVNDSGKKKSRLVKKRAQLCRKNGKISAC